MRPFQSVVTALLVCLSLTVGARDLCAVEPNDELRGVIVLCRHGVRAPIESEIRGSRYNAQPWPKWDVQSGVLTERGTRNLEFLGTYYRSRYTALFPKESCGAVYAEANTTPRTIASAKAMLGGLASGCAVEVHTRPNGNPLFMATPSSLVDRQTLAASVTGRMANRPEWFTAAFAAPLAHMHQILTECTGKPDCDQDKPDFRKTLAAVSAPAGRGLLTVESPVSLGADFAEHFLLQYTEGMPMEKVGWGRVSRADLDSLMEMNTRFHDFVQRTPHFARVNASNLAENIRATAERAASGKTAPNALGDPANRFVLLVAHDGNLASLGGLLRLDWLLPDQTFNATPPGSGLVFEVHHDRTTGVDNVQVFFISQTLDQMRNLTPLEGPEAPSVAPVFVPGCSGTVSSAPYACTIEAFNRIVAAAIDPRLVEKSAAH